MTKIRQSKELTAFYNAYNDWLKEGAPEVNKYKFSRGRGLCHAIQQYSHANSLPWEMTYQSQYNLFSIAKLDTTCPFGRINYINRGNNFTQHLDPVRIAWVRSHLTEEVDEEFTFK